MSETIRPNDLAGRLGLSFRQIDYWVRTDRLHTVDWDGTSNPLAGSGRHRSLPTSEIFIAETVGRLLAAGFVLDSAFALARDLASGQAVITLAPGLRLHHVPGRQERPKRTELAGQLDLLMEVSEAGGG